MIIDRQVPHNTTWPHGPFRGSLSVFRFVEDGCQRARDPIELSICAQVEQEYADRLKAASLFQRYMRRREMRKEIQRRIDARAPPDALY